MKNRRPPQCTLEIRELVLGVHLGCGAEERREPQSVSFSAAFRFLESPRGMLTDELSDSLCYAQVSDAIKSEIQGSEFKLIEHLGHRLFERLRQLAGETTEIRLQVHKLNPPVDDLRGGSFFTIAEF